MKEMIRANTIYFFSAEPGRPHRRAKGSKHIERDRFIFRALTLRNFSIEGVMRPIRGRPGLFVIVAAILLLTFFHPLAQAGVKPNLNKGNKWRIAYYEGGPYTDYKSVLVATLSGLVKLGWLEPLTLPKNIDDANTKKVWSYLAGQAKSDYLEFLADGFMSAGWKTETRIENKKRMIHRLAAEKDIDLIIAMGTWAGKDLANNRHSIPVFVMSTSDPVRAKIIKSPEHSGYDHVFARCDPKRYERQIRLFHRIFNFKKLGLICEDSSEGRLYAGWQDVAKVAKERGFKIVPCYAKDSDIAEDEMIRATKECFEKICPRIDAFWLSGNNGLQDKYIHNYVPILLKYKIPSWAMVQNISLVQHGVLMALSKNDYGPLGLFQAETIAKIFNGAKPGELNQIFEDLNTLVINTKTAELIDFKPPNSILRISDLIFNEIEK